MLLIAVPAWLSLASGAYAQVVITNDDETTPPPAQTPAPAPAPAPAPPVTAPAPAPTPGTSVVSGPGATPPPGSVVVSASPEAEGGAGKTMLVAGIVSLAVGYGIALIGGAITTGVGVSQESQYKGTCVAGGPLNFIPLIGPFLYAGGYPDHEVIGYGQGRPESFDCQNSMGLTTGVVATSEVLQLGGVALIAGSFVFRALTTVPVGQTGMLSIIPGAMSTPAGLTLELVGP